MTVKTSEGITRRRSRIRVESTTKDDISDLEWFATHPAALDAYEGKYVAIFRKHVIASAVTIKDLMVKSKRENVTSRPLIVRVGRNYESVL